METYPIAGQLLEQKFLLGISMQDLVDVFLIPFLFVGIVSFVGASESSYLWIGGVGFALSFVILIKTPPAQRPRHWVAAYLSFKLGTTTYLNRPVIQNTDRGKIQDVVLTASEFQAGPRRDSS